jgi:hypothetical protein
MTWWYKVYLNISSAHRPHSCLLPPLTNRLNFLSKFPPSRDTMPSLSKFLSVALFSALAQSLPFSEKDLATRATGEKVDGSLYVPASSTASLSSSWSAPSSPATVKLSSNNGLSGGPVSYQLFTGNGQQWPAIDKWMDFEDM